MKSRTDIFLYYMNCHIGWLVGVYIGCLIGCDCRCCVDCGLDYYCDGLGCELRIVVDAGSGCSTHNAV